jgi:hypothetical protein
MRGAGLGDAFGAEKGGGELGRELTIGSLRSEIGGLVVDHRLGYLAESRNAHLASIGVGWSSGMQQGRSG